MFRKLFALEIAALASNDEPTAQTECRENDLLETLREVFTPRSAAHGSMWSMRSVA